MRKIKVVQGKGILVCLCACVIALASPVILAQGLAAEGLSNAEILGTDSVVLIMRQIELVEAEENTFSPRLGELSFDLGSQLASLGLHEEALEAFQRADQNMKVADGLYSATREIIVRKIYEQQISLKNWDDAEVALENLAWVKARNLDAMSVDYVQILQELVEWNLARDYYDLDEEDESSISLRRAHADLEKIYNIYQSRGLPFDNRTVELSSAVNHRMAMKVNLVPVGDRREAINYSSRRLSRRFNVIQSACQSQYPDPELREISAHCISLGERHLRSVEPDTVVFDPWDTGIGDTYDQSALFFSRSYFRGKDVLLNQLATYNESEDKSRALDALLNLADWYLLFGHYNSAQQTYAAAWSFAAEQQLGGLLEMSVPQPISMAGVIHGLPELRSGYRQGDAEFAVTIGANGEVEKIEFAETNIEDEAGIAQLAAEISTYRYRPALRQGVPILADGYLVDAQLFY
jgi:hypothetical protein